MSILESLKPLSPFRLSGKKLAHLKDVYGDISVIESRNYLTLTFDMIYEQSKMLKQAPSMPIHHYIRAMLMALPFTLSNRILVLGLGGGCLVRAIHAYNQQTIIDVVELRKSVMDVAMEYFGLPKNTNVNYLIQDARNFMLTEPKEKYNIIFSDLYSEDAMDPLQSKGSFLVSCADNLTDTGWLVMNYHIAPDISSVFSHALHTLFKTVLYCTTSSGNVIIYASKTDDSISLSKYQTLGNSVGELFSCDVSALAQKISLWPKPL